MSPLQLVKRMAGQKWSKRHEKANKGAAYYIFHRAVTDAGFSKSDHVPNNVNVLYVVSVICYCLHHSIYVTINVRDYPAGVVAEPLLL